MSPRLDFFKISPQGVAALRQLESYLAGCGLEHSLLELVKTRASQINGCAYCLDMHSKDARADGETEQRLYSLDAWEEAPYYSDRERAALAWTEAVTLLSNGHVPDDTYERARVHFSEAEIAALTLAIAMINSWNRLNVALRTEAGGYRPGMFNRLRA